MSKELDEGDADRILEAINEYLIIPKSLESYDVEKQLELAIRIKKENI